MTTSDNHTQSPQTDNNPIPDASDWRKFVDWRTVGNPPTGDRRRDFGIAERLGFRFAQMPTYSAHYLEVYYPGDEKSTGGFWNEVNPLDSHAIPHYSTDLNAAWGLLAGLKAEITLKTYPDGQRTLVSWWDRVWNTGSAETPAIAICNAWLNWWDWQHENAEPPPDSPMIGGAYD